MKQIKVNPSNEPFYSKEFVRGFNLGAQRQFEADKADMPTWIPCSERLPEEHTEVLLLGIKNMMVGYWQEGDFEGERAWRIMSGDGWETDATFPPDVFEPIAWMPLPEPWKGAENETD